MQEYTLHYYRGLSNQRKLELWAILIVAIFGILGTIFVIKATLKTNYSILGVERLHTQNEQLQQNNLRLIATVQDVTESLNKRISRDSANAQMLKENNSLLPSIDTKLNIINRKYETITNTATVTDTELAEYVASEAERIRREGNR